MAAPDGVLALVPSLQELRGAVLGLCDALIAAGNSIEDLAAKVRWKS